MVGARGRVARTAFTLSEVVVASAVTGILLVGLASAVILTAQALPSRSSAADAAISGADAVDELARDLRYATAVDTHLDRMITFQVPDRERDGLPETIRYEWSGKVGEPLVRQVNAGPVATVADDVHQFALSLKTRAETVSQTNEQVVTGSEVLLAEFTTWPGILGVTTTYTQSLTSSSWLAESFSVAAGSVPARATKLTITRARFKIRTTSSQSAVTAEVHRASGVLTSSPTFTRVGSPGTYSGKTGGSSPVWVDIPFGDVVLTDWSGGLAVILKGAGAEFAEYLANILGSDNGTVCLVTSNSGSSWSPSIASRHWYDAPFEVYGKFDSTVDVATEVTTHYLQSVGLTLQLGSDAAAALGSAVETPNEPAVVLP